MNFIIVLLNNKGLKGVKFLLINTNIMKKHISCYLCVGLSIIVFAFLPKTSYADVLYVDQSAAGANDGSSWTDAYVSLENGLAAAVAGDEIWIAEGVYKPVSVIDLNGDGVPDGREAVFFIPGGVALYGGFNGTETDRNERNWTANLTILSGDIDNNDLNADGNFIAESTGDVVGNNSYHVIYTENADPSTRVDGIIITAGRADIATPVSVTDPNLDGGGWYNQLSAPAFSSSPTIVNTTFTGNYAVSEGGAFYTKPGPVGGVSSSVIENCMFLNNYSGQSGGAIYLGSFNNGDYEPEIINCTFTGNEAYRIGGAIYLVGDNATVVSSLFGNNQVTAVSAEMETLPGSGGAVALVASNASFTACMFENNSSTGNATGASEGGGGGAVYATTNEPQTVSLGASMPSFTGCGFYDNSTAGNGAAWGGAINFKNDDGMLQPSLVNCVFSGNTAQNHGGAVFCFTRVVGAPEGYSPVLEPVFTNCTFSNNSAGDDGGAAYFQGYEYLGSQVLQAAIENSILWGNNASDEGDQIFTTGNVNISYSLIEGSGGSGIGWDSSIGTDGGNNIDGNPGFVNAGNPMGADGIPATNDDGLRLTQFSDAVNTGNNAASGLSGISEDFAGSLRILSGIVDMGAYERTGFILPDFDFVWIIDWPQIQPPCLTCPLPWSFLLFHAFGFEPQYVWKEPAQFIRSGSSATISGEIVNALRPEISFKVFLKLEREQTWKTWSKRQGSWFTKTDGSLAVAESEHVNWKFWKLSTSSYLEGTGDIRGVLKLKQWSSSEKTGFQMGLGANAWDEDFGLAGYFNYNGKLTYKRKKIKVKGLGSMNVDGIPCEDNCEEQFKQPEETKGWGRFKSASFDNTNLTDESIKIYPVPAKNYLVLESIPAAGVSVVRILDVSGRTLITENWLRHEGRHTIRLDKLNSGLHFIQIIPTNTGDVFSGKFVKE